MRWSTIAAVLALCFVASSVSAARVSGWENPLFTSNDGPEVVKSNLHRAGGAKSGNGDEADKYIDRRAFVAIKYRVPPSLHDEFIDAWRDLEKDVVKEEDDNIMYALSKTAQDNVVFAVYGEWDTFADYIEHLHSEHVRAWLDFLEDKDITWELYPLKNVTDVEQERRSTRSLKLNPNSEDDANRGKKRKQRMAHVLFHYHTEPSAKDDFIDAWQDLAKNTWDEDSNVVFSLRKISTNNHHFIGYGSWESWEDMLDHFESDHSKDFRKFAEKNDVLWFFEPVFQLGKEDRD